MPDGSTDLPGLKLVAKLAAVASSRHVAHATRAATVLNFVGTIRGAVTTLLVISSAAGGAATINTVRQELSAAQDQAAIQSVLPTASPATVPPRRAAEAKLRETFAANGKAADELRKVAVLSGRSLDQLIADAKRQMQVRYERGLAQLATLAGTALGADPETVDATSDGTILVMNALIQVMSDDLGAILLRATSVAMGQTPETVAGAEVAATFPGSAGATISLLRADATAKLLGTFDADMRSADDLRRIATAAAARIDPIIVDTKRKLQRRYDEGSALLDTLIGPAAGGATPSSPDSRVDSVNALVALIANDLNAILAASVKSVGAPPAAIRTAAPPAAYIPPARAAAPLSTTRPTIIPTRAPAAVPPTPVRTPVPASAPPRPVTPPSAPPRTPVPVTAPRTPAPVIPAPATPAPTPRKT